MIKNFSQYLNEESDTSNSWEDALYEACKVKFYGSEEEVSMFSEIYDQAFGPEYTGDMPGKEEIMEKIVDLVKDALNKAVFTEEEENEIEEES